MNNKSNVFNVIDNLSNNVNKLKFIIITTGLELTPEELAGRKLVINEISTSIQNIIQTLNKYSNKRM